MNQIYFSFFWSNTGFRPVGLGIQGLKVILQVDDDPSSPVKVPVISHTIPYILCYLASLLFTFFEIKVEGAEIQVINRDKMKWFRFEHLCTGTLELPSLTEAIDAAFDAADVRCFGISLRFNTFVLEDTPTQPKLTTKDNVMALVFTKNRLKNSKFALVGVFHDWNIDSLKETHPDSESPSPRIDSFEIQKFVKVLVKNTKSFFQKAPRIYLTFPGMHIQHKRGPTSDFVVAVSIRRVDVSLFFGSANPNQIQMDSQIRVQGITLKQNDTTQLGTVREIALNAEIQLENVKDSARMISHVNTQVNDPWLVIEIQKLFEIVKVFQSSEEPVSSPKGKVSGSLLTELKKMVDFQLGVHVLNANIALLIENIESDEDVFHYGGLFSLEHGSVACSTISVESSDLTIPRTDLHGTMDLVSVKFSTFCRSTCDYLFDLIPDLEPFLTIPSLQFSNTFDIFKNSVDSSLAVRNINLDLSLIKESNVEILVALFHKVETLQSMIPKKNSAPLEASQETMLSCNLHVHLGSFIAILPSDRQFSVTFGFSEFVGKFEIDDSISSNVVLDHIFLEAGSPACPHTKILRYESPQFTQKALGAVIQVSGKSILLGMSLSKFFVLFDSVLGVLKLLKEINIDEKDKEQEKKKRDNLQVLIKIPSIVIDFELPESVHMKFIFNTLKLKTATEKKLVGELDSVDIDVIRSPQDFYSELARINDVNFEVAPNGKPIDIVFNAGFAKLLVAHGWRMSNIVENFVNLNRALKQLVFDALGLPPPSTKFATGRTFVNTISFPNLIFKSSVLELIFEDDQFESKLSRNYLAGLEENSSRLSREKEFMRKVKSRYPELSRDEYTHMKNNLYTRKAPSSKMEKEIRKAWDLLQDFNAQAYQKAISSMNDTFHPLLKITIWGAALNLRTPSFDDPLEIVLNRIDCTTPTNIIYDDMMPFQIKSIVCGMEVCLRDYKSPLLYLPNVGDTYCEMNGLIIIAEPKSKPECTRVVTLPLDCDPDLIVQVFRNVNPTKIYLETATDVSTLSTVQICVGTPLEPALAEVINVIDNFTHVTDDPSPPIGWWDKLRIVLHGNNTFRIHGSGQIRFRVLGSSSPYFDPRKHFGVEGLECILSNGLEVNLGGKSELTEMVVDCGELKMTFPKTFDRDTAHEDAVCLAKLSGGVKLILTTDFLTNSPKDPTVHIKPWMRHHEILLQTIQSRRVSGFVGHNSSDSFFGFRSHHISVKLEIQSPRSYFSGLSTPQNVLFLTKDTMEGVEKIFSVYQSLLTNVPIKRGSLFNQTLDGFQKPKLGRVIDAVHLKIILLPALVSFTQQCENGDEYVGIRMRANSMNVDAFFRQYDVKQSPDIQQELERKAVTKWIRVESAISFLEIEGRVLSYCEKNSDLIISGSDLTQKEMDYSGWVFKEDQQFPDLSKLGMLPCLWAPRLDFLRLENSKQTSITEETSNKVIFQVQLQILQLRLREIDSMIWACKNQIKVLESRGIVFLDDSVKHECIHLMHELSLLHDKRSAIKDSIEECNKSLSFEEEDAFNPSTAFDTKYIVHNVKILWNVPVRNIIFRLVDVHTKNRSLKYCLSNAAAQVTSELVQTMTAEQNRKRRRENLSHMPSFHTPKDDVSDILKGLIRDLEEGVKLVIPCEEPTEPIVQETSKSNFADNGKNPDIDFKLSDDEEDTHYESDVLVSFLNPQINFEVEGTINGKSSVVVSAHRMQVKFYLQFDPSAATLGLDKDQQDTIISFRNIWSLDKAQFLVQSNKDQFGLDKFGKDRLSGQKRPRWIPIECVLNNKLPAPLFVRVIDKAVVMFQTEEANALYIHRNNEKSHTEQTSTYRFQMPVLKVSAASEQYLILSDLFKNLLVYIDPASGERADRAKKMLLTLEQCEDIQYYRIVMLSLQEKVKHYEFMLKYGKRGDVPLTLEEVIQTKKAYIECRNDLYVLMEGLKNLQNIEMKRRSMNVAWQLIVQIDHFNWLMLQDNHEPICKWTIEDLNFVWINNEDQSSVNTLEVDSTFVENLSHTSVIFKDVISPYVTDSRDITSEKQKVIRVYWRENAPVAGIQVVDHFEINMHPLLIQMTYDFGKMVGNYLFPSSSAANTDASAKNTKHIDTTSEPKERKSQYGFQESNQMKQMQVRANQNKSFIYIKVPGVEHCLSYRGSKEKNIEDLNKFTFFLPTLEYRNKTWTWFDFLQAVKKDALRAALANTGALVREKLFVKKNEEVRNDSDESDRQSVESLSPKLPKKDGKFLIKAFAKKNHDFNLANYMKSNLSAEDLAMDSLEDVSNPAKQELLAPTLALLQHKGKIIFGNHFVLQK